MTSTTEQEHVTTARIEADPTIPGIRFVRDFQGTPEQLFRATPSRTCSCDGTGRTA
jgi:hypothetical protein